MDIKEQIQYYLDFKGINTNQLEVSIGVSKSYWRKTKSISANIVSEICRIYTDLNIEWIFTGKGSMIKTDSILVRSPDSSSDIYERMLEKKDKRIEKLILEIGHLQQEIKTLKQDKKSALEMEDVLGAAKMTGTNE